MVVRGASAGARRPSAGGALGTLLLLAAASSAKRIGQVRAQVPAPSRNSFARGADLPTLREHIDAATRHLSAAVSAEDYSRACVLRDRVSRLRARDPQHRYSELSRALQAAIAAEDYSAARQLHDELLGVKNHLPQYQLAGLWRGLYPQQGEEIIRIQYARDDPNLLLAYKVTGDEYVPRGKITFTAELLHERTASRRTRDGQVSAFWGTGQCAQQGFQNPHFMAGELLMYLGGGIGFRWKTLGTTILFHRVDGMEAEAIEESEAASGSGPGEGSDWDIVCDLDQIINDGGGPL